MFFDLYFMFVSPVAKISHVRAIPKIRPEAATPSDKVFSTGMGRGRRWIKEARCILREFAHRTAVSVVLWTGQVHDD